MSGCRDGLLDHLVQRRYVARGLWIQVLVLNAEVVRGFLRAARDSGPEELRRGAAADVDDLRVAGFLETATHRGRPTCLLRTDGGRGHCGQ
jgi:hypothetical protein